MSVICIVQLDTNYQWQFFSRARPAAVAVVGATAVGAVAAAVGAVAAAVGAVTAAVGAVTAAVGAVAAAAGAVAKGTTSSARSPINGSSIKNLR